MSSYEAQVDHLRAQLNCPTTWQSIATAPKNDTVIWLSDGWWMRLGFWAVNTAHPEREQWVDFAKADSYARGPPRVHFEPKFWQPTPLCFLREQGIPGF